MEGSPEKVKGLVEETTEASTPNSTDVKNAYQGQDEMFIQPKDMSEHLAWESLKMQINDNKSERELRTSHANKSFWFTLGWASFISLIILLKGFGILKLDRVEFLSVIGALTTTVFGFYLLVMKFLFSRNNGIDNKPVKD